MLMVIKQVWKNIDDFPDYFTLNNENILWCIVIYSVSAFFFFGRHPYFPFFFFNQDSSFPAYKFVKSPHKSLSRRTSDKAWMRDIDCMQTGQHNTPFSDVGQTQSKHTSKNLPWDKPKPV